MHAIRWWFAVSMSAVGFALAWLLADAAGLDTRFAVGVATVAAAFILTPLAWFASRSGPPSPASGQTGRALADAATVVFPAVAAADGDPSAVRRRLVVGDVPVEAVAWQRRTHLLDRLAKELLGKESLDAPALEAIFQAT